MNDLDEGAQDDVMDLTIPEPGWTVTDLSRALAPEPGGPRGPGRLLEAKVQPAPAGGAAFTLRDAHAHEWTEVASCPRPGYTIFVYRAGPGFLVRKKFLDSDLLHIRACATRIEVCRYLTEKMNAVFFAKVVWGFLSKVA